MLTLMVSGLLLQGAPSEYDQMLTALQASVRGRVLVFAPSIFDVRLAETLRQTQTDPVRQTRIGVVTVPYYNYLPHSTVLSLALANVPIYELQIASLEGVVIVDDTGWRGPELGKTAHPDLSRMSSSELNETLRWFQAATGRGHRISQYEAFLRIKQVLK